MPETSPSAPDREKQFLVAVGAFIVIAVVLLVLMSIRQVIDGNENNDARFGTDQSALATIASSSKSRELRYVATSRLTDRPALRQLASQFGGVAALARVRLTLLDANLREPNLKVTNYQTIKQTYKGLWSRDSDVLYSKTMEGESFDLWVRKGNTDDGIEFTIRTVFPDELSSGRYDSLRFRPADFSAEDLLEKVGLVRPELAPTRSSVYGPMPAN